MGNKLKRAGAWLMTVAMLMQSLVSWNGVFTAYAAAGDDLTTPAASKVLTPNGDGSYTLSLSVAGQSSSQTEENDINVILILDSSGSMGNSANIVNYELNNSAYGNGSANNWQRYGIVNGAYVEVNWRTQNGGWWYYWQNGSRVPYTGDRYRRTTSNSTRLDATKLALDRVVTALLANNTDSNPDAVEIAMVEFGTRVKNTYSTWSNDYDTIMGHINDMEAGGGTDWEDAFKAARGIAGNDTDGDGQNDPVYVIFVTDGNPTMYTGSQTSYNNDSQVSYERARDDSKKLVADDGATLYGIFAYGSATGTNYLDDLINYSYDDNTASTTGGKYYDAKSTEALEDALSAILQSIYSSASFGRVTINDGVTAMAATDLKSVSGSVTGFTYTMKKGDETKTVVPGTTGTVTFGSGDSAVTVNVPSNGATVTEAADGTKNVQWNLGNDYVLADGVTYTVSFVIWPDQDAYDLVADLNNGLISYDDLTAKQKSMIPNKKPYTLKTNTNQSVDYSIVEVIDDGSGNPQTTYDPHTYQIPYSGEMELTGLKALKIKKDWNSDLDSAQKSEIKYITLDVLYDKECDGITNDLYMTVRFYGKETAAGSGQYDWSNPDMYIVNGDKETLAKDDEIWIAVGYTLNGEVKNPGHYYKVEETEIKTASGSSSVHFELDTEVLHPMLIGTSKSGSTPAKLTTSWGENVKTAGTLTATNNLKGGVSVTKKVTAAKGVTPDADTEFTFNIALGSYGDPNVAYRIYHADGSRTSKVAIDSAKTVTIKAGDTIRIQDMPAGTTYTISEVTTGMAAGYSFDKAEITKTQTGADLAVSGSTFTGKAVADASPEATFTNKYELEPVTASFPVKKVLDVPAGLTGPTDWSFTITVADDTSDSVTSPLPATKTGTVTKAEPVTNFGPITYTIPGTYKYTVSESGKVAGVSMESSKTVTVVVVDNGDGTMTVKSVSSTEADPLTFTNTYGVKSTTATPQFSKKLNVEAGLNAPSIKGKFTFTLTAKSPADAPMPATTSKTNPDNGTAQVTDFSAITFTKPGTYVYTVTESGSVDGVSAVGATSVDVTITVVDNNDGTLTARVDKVAAFTNEYKVTPATATPQFSKKLNVAAGLNAPDITGKFTFTIAAKSPADAPMPATTSKTNPDNGTAQVTDFSAITFTKPGTYVYTVTETGTVAGVSAVGATSVDVTIKVVDNGDGTMTATTDKVAAFTNEYKVTPAKATPQFSKKLNVAAGLNAPDITGKFTFTIAAKSPADAPMPATTSKTNPDNGTAQVTDFSEITFTAPGTYVYTVTETGTVKGVSAVGATSVDVTITVTDNGDGTLTARADKVAAFTNQYTVGTASVTPKFSKALQVAQGLNAPDITGKFTFTITAKSPADAPLPATTSKTNPDNGTAQVTEFGAIEFTKPGTYVYTVTESGSVAGVSAVGATSVDVTVVVTDNGDGTLSAEIDKTAEFTNQYTVTPTTATPKFSKKLNAAAGLNAPDITGKFTFTIAAKSPADAPMPATTSKTNPDNGTAQVTEFGEIEFTKPGTYVYTVTETGSVDGISAVGATTVDVTITVTDNGDGTLTALVDKTAAFTNEYKVTSAKATPKFSKTLQVAQGLNAPDITGAFTFTITAKSPADAPMPATTSKTNPDNGTAQVTEFGEIEFTKPGTYVYTVTETGSVAGVSAVGSTAIDVTVTVVDNGDGTLTATVDKTAEFTNQYTVGSATVTPKFSKTLQVAQGLNAPDITGKFTFTITAKSPANAPLPATTSKTNPDNGTAQVTEFGAIEFTQPGTYVYTVTETGSVDGVSAVGATTVDVTVIVTDNGDGTLSAEIDKTAEFTNQYTVTPATATPKFSKALQVERGLNAPDITGAFTFTIAAKSPADAPMPADTAKTNPDNGTAQVTEFGEIEFTKPGTYVYTVTETGSVAGVSAVGATSVDVTITVVDNGDGTMTATVDKTAEFTNQYTVTPATATPKFSKALQVERGLNAPDITDAFTFTITAKSPANAPLPQAASKTNPDNGTAQVTEFGAIEFTKPGTYVYTVTETGTVAGVSAVGATAVDVTITVVDNGDGTMTATVDKTAEFTNQYTVTPATATPKFSKALQAAQGLNAPDITGKFTFTIAAKSPADAPLPQTVSKTNPDNGTAQVTEFGAIEFTKPGTYVYTVTESGSVAGVSAVGATTVDVTITVVDNGDGTMTATVDKTAEFTNQYTVAPTTATPQFSKTLSVAAGLNAPDITGKFTFTISAKDPADAPMPKTASKTNPDNGLGTATDFSAITFTKPGTYVYSVEETGDLAGVSAVGSKTVDVTITVVDNGDGTMTASVDKVAEFTNQYTVGSITATPQFSKALQVAQGLNAPDITGKFTFTITAKSPADAPMPATTSKTNPDNGVATKADYGIITFTKPGTYVYTITETGSVDGVSAVSATAIDVTVTVTDKGDGTLAASVDKSADFVNQYTVAPTTATPKFSKALQVERGLNAPDITGAFTFTITAKSPANAPLPAETAKTNPDNGTAQVTEFGEIEFTKPGTYVYTVTETGRVAGVSAVGSTAIDVTVTVVDNGNGTMTATVDKTAEFTNQYTVTSTTATPKFSKALQVAQGLNAPDITGAFTFTITAKSPADAPLPQTASKTNPDNGTAQVTEFGEIEFTKPGTYVYTVTETGTVAGVSAVGSTAIDVTVTVVDNGDGTLTATVDKTAEFTNQYTVTPTTATPKFSKALQVERGLNAPDITGAFTFTIAAKSPADAPMPAETSKTNPDNGTAQVTEFGVIEFTKPGTYVYTVTESGQLAGISAVGATAVDVTITVVDNGDGTMTASVDKVAEFTNEYTVAPTTATPKFSKALKVERGLNAPDITGAFTFTIAAKSPADAPMPAETSKTNPDNGTAQVTDFSEITFTKPGTYVYTVTETGELAGISAVGATAVDVTITVVDNGYGTMTATVDKTAEFTNEYTVAPTTATPKFSKALKVAAGLNAPDITDAFTFTITAKEPADAPLPAETAKTNPDNGLATETEFGAIEFTKPGTYVYTVTETGELAGISAVGATAVDVTITVVDNGDGTMTATVDKTAEFTNEYTVAPISATPKFSKALKVAAGLNAPDITGAFTFTITAKEPADAPLPAETAKTNPDNGLATETEFGAIEFTKPGTYVYTVTETGELAGISAVGETTVDVTITVVDNGDGTMTATVDKTAEFTNEYTVAPTTATPQFSKLFSFDKGLNAPDITGKFTFTIAAKSPADAPMPETTSKTNPDNGTAQVTDFSAITFTKPGTYVYTVTESGELAGVSAVSDTEIDITVTVVDNGDGTLTASIDKVAEFENEYTVKPVVANFPVDKLIGLTDKLIGPKTWSYTVKLTAGTDENGEASPMPVTGAEGTVSNDAPSFTFGDIVFTKPGEYTYSISEEGSVAGVGYDPLHAGKEVKVVVVDNGDGTLTATATSTKENPVVFTNPYSVKPIEVTIPAIKTLEIPEGMEAPEDWAFAFVISAVNRAPMKGEDGKNIENVKIVDKDNLEVGFGKIVFSVPGTYEYKIREDGEVEGIINDEELEKTATVVVTDNGDGTLSAEVTGVEFVNSCVMLPQTGDTFDSTLWLALMFASSACMAVLFIYKKREEE